MGVCSIDDVMYFICNKCGLVMQNSAEIEL